MTNHARQPRQRPVFKAERKIAEKPVNYYQVEKYKRLRYNQYSSIDEQHRQRVQDVAVDIHGKLKRTVQDMIEIGEQLIEVKQYFPHGKFEEWLNEEFGLSIRSARNFMISAKHYADKSAIIADLDVTTVYLLAAPSTPKEARAEVDAMLRMNLVPTYAEVSSGGG